MSNTILLKKSGTANAIPASGNLALGELAINYADGNLFYKDGAGTVKVIASNQFSSVVGNVTGGNLVTAGIVTATGNITGGNVLTGGLISATSTITSAANITGGNLLTAGLISATANVTGGNVLTAGLISATSTITSAANITGGNVLTGGLISATGNIDGAFINGNGYFLTGIITSVANINNGTSNVNIATANANITVSVDGTSNVVVFATTGEYITGLLSASGTVTGGNLLTAGLISATSTITSAANITGGNVLTGGLISATGTVTGSSLLGSVASLSGNVTGGNLLTVGLASISGTVTGGNLLTAGLISATGNIQGANVNTDQLRNVGGNLTIGVTGGNLLLQPSGNVILSANTYINNLAYPFASSDAATKEYVDNLATTAIAYHQAVYVATTANLATTTGGAITYAQPNGVANGIGATITTTGTFELIDTANVQTVGTRILVKNEGNAVFNGVYTWSNATVITRSTDTDQYGAASAEEFSINDYFFVQSGNVNAGAAYIVDAPTGTITFGTSNIAFAQFSSSQVYTANTAAGISLNGTVINAKIDNITTAFDGSGNIIVKASANLTTPNIGAATGTSLSATGNVTGGNLLTGGLISATATITGGNLATGGLVTATGNITGGNVLTGGLISATGTVTGSSLLGSVVSVTANITGGNLLTAGLISSTGNITSAGNIAGGNVLATTAMYVGGASVLTIDSTVDGGTY